MAQLIEQLVVKFHISKEQATGILDTVKEYVAVAHPSFGNSLDIILNSETGN
jgi:hypothetical protein